MAHYIDADRLRARIEKKLQENADKALVFGAAFAGRTAEDNEIINLLDTLPEQPVLPGIVEDERVGIPGRDFIPVDWVDACERYGKWKIVRAEQPVEGLEEEIIRYLREECSSDNEPSVSEIARHFAEWGAEHLKR